MMKLQQLGPGSDAGEPWHNNPAGRMLSHYPRDLSPLSMARHRIMNVLAISPEASTKLDGVL
jgi:hypothetical protein